ncbi:LysE family translocator [Paracoccus jiaweipingae]|uniref:LysE family translocator n=1 Tax=unclassified Paracoccus (in: a-proteobacteria) TaxID=2688777 RepID=UPI0037BC0499
MDAITLSQILLFVITLGVAIVTPGPAILAASRSAAARGWRPTLPYALGLAFGASIWALAAAFGLTVVFRLLPQFYAAFKVAGGLYLLWVAVQLWRHADDPVVDDIRVARGPGFMAGFVLNASNPKPALFYSAVLLTIFPMLHGIAGPLLIYAVALSVEISFFLIVTALMATGPVRRRYIAASAWIDRIAAGLIGALGLSLIFRQ